MHVKCAPTGDLPHCSTLASSPYLVRKEPYPSLSRRPAPPRSWRFCTPLHTHLPHKALQGLTTKELGMNCASGRLLYPGSVPLTNSPTHQPSSLPPSHSHNHTISLPPSKPPTHQPTPLPLIHTTTIHLSHSLPPSF